MIENIIASDKSLVVIIPSNSWNKYSVIITTIKHIIRIINEKIWCLNKRNCNKYLLSNEDVIKGYFK